ncbi:rhodanese-like domain-containing protein, partial [Anaerosporobacter sp.]|uniref:rhodanese-like domain-containing protein n=1 Tax=Anaerosporobacter sp. TaxID=1872529 RepID=UPI00286F4FD8
MKKRKLVFVGTLLGAILLSGCREAASSEYNWLVQQDSFLKPVLEQILPQYTKISPEEAQSMISDNVIILDVRTHAEYEDGHIKNAVLLPYYEIQDRAKRTLKDKNQTILVYSQTPERSEQEAKKLVDMGYRKVYDVGSIGEWKGEIVGNWLHPSYYNYFGGELPDDIVTPIDITTTMKVNEEMPEFTVHITGNNIKRYTESDDESICYVWFDANCIENMSIIDDEGNLVQSIGGMDTENKYSEEYLYGVSFEDWNFDGNLDIGLSICPGGSLRNTPHYYWLWDEKLGRFVENKELMDMSDMAGISIDKENESISCFMRYGSAGSMSMTYKYIDGRYILVYSSEMLIESTGEGKEPWVTTRIITKKLIDG